MTAWEGSQARGWSEPWEEREIIQIAMLALDRDSLKPLNHYSCLVKPTLNPELSDYISKLTGITQNAVDHDGVPLSQALRDVEAFYDDFEGPAELLCNGEDGQVICHNAALVGVSFPEFLHCCQTIRPYLQKYIPTYRRGHCTGDIPDLISRPLEGHKHNALYDVHALALALRYIEEIKENPSL